MLTVPDPEPPVPVPETGTCCGLLGSLSVKTRVAVRVPARVGLNKRLTVQLEEAARLEPQVFVCEKSVVLVPVKVMLVILTAAVPELVRVTVFAPLVLPTATGPQVSDVGDGVTNPVPPLAPVPESETDKFVEPPVMFHVALSEPAVLGLKTTAAVQVPEAARLDPQVVD